MHIVLTNSYKMFIYNIILIFTIIINVFLPRVV